MPTIRLSPIMHLFLVTMTLAGCPESSHLPDADGNSEPTYVEVPIRNVMDVDLLFVIDNSGSMVEEQEVLTDQFVVMAQELIAPTDPTALAVESLHVGVASTDMGTGGHTIQTCFNSDVGDDGVLQPTGRLDGCEDAYGAPDCDRASCPWLVHSAEFPDDGSDPRDPPIWEDFACIATLGSGGCGFEQHLESSYRALVEQTQPGGHNEGFLRDDSLLAIVFVTDEDDCSSDEPEFFDPARDDLEPLNTRCVINADRLSPVSRYHDALVELHGDRVVVAAIAGVPVDGSWAPGDPLEELRALQQVDPSDPLTLRRSCVTSMGVAFPPVRIVELVYSFGERGVLTTVCTPDYTPALGEIAHAIQRRLGTSCVEIAAGVDAEAGCRLVEVIDDDREIEVPHVGIDTEGWDIVVGEGCPGGQLQLGGEPIRQDGFVFECEAAP